MNKLTSKANNNKHCVLEALSPTFHIIILIRRLLYWL
nr:MAG TPA: hypothetical protein [Caudoviricetes sp.]